MKWKKAHSSTQLLQPRANQMTNRMASTDATNFRLSVLNPGGRDLEQYLDEPLRPGEIGHPPVNLHAFAACTEGSFHRATKNAIVEKRSILLVLRGNFKAAERALAECQKEQRLVAITLKETGLHQIAQQLHDPKQLARFMRIVAKADGCVATTPEAAEIFRRTRPDREPDTVAFIPTPYPLEDEQWKFTVPPGEQRGIFIGTREWDVPSRNHFGALLLARSASAGMVRLIASPLAIIADKDAPRLNSRQSRWICSKTRLFAQPRLWRRTGAPPSASPFQRCEDNSRSFSTAW